MGCSSAVSKKQQSVALKIQKNGEEEEEIQENNDVIIATHLYLKPNTNGAPLDREVVLRRIRHRKRVRVVQALLTSPFSSNKSAVSSPRVKWLDDAFAAL